jgi:hypothetical protein
MNNEKFGSLGHFLLKFRVANHTHTGKRQKLINRDRDRHRKRV